MSNLPPAANPSPLELWGGVEPTVNRVGDRFFDQLERNGHAGARGEEDLARFAALGLRALRYPVLWERHAPEEPIVQDWSWADQRLGRMRELGMRPIVGLIHHGSGPRRTNLLDPGFADGLADYARQVAERFPWVEEWTPVNEPLTTARFSALYGHWYPHAHDDRSFARALLHQCRAVVLAMRAIRRVNPAARLVQTEDLGRSHSTRPLAAQAEFENTRRWLTWDLLEGRVNPAHGLWAYLLGPGEVDEGELRWFMENPCPPDVLGVNTYVTSERFLDHRLGRYPAYARAGTGEQPHADVVAVRVSRGEAAGPGRLLREAWARYGRPVAITEAHLACSREEQMRWIMEIWRDARALREREGADVRAVTLWSLLGTFDWCHLLTREAGDYESGVFDLRTPGSHPRPTALARLARELATTGDSVHPAVTGPGWWRRSSARFDHPPAQAYQALSPAVGGRRRSTPEPAVPLLILGAGTRLGREFAAVCAIRALSFQAFGEEELDVMDPAAVRDVLNRWRPWAVIHAGEGYPPGVDAAEGEPDACWRANVLGPETLARACARHAPDGLPLVTFSSNLVFDGEGREPYDEGATPNPQNVFGRTKFEGENRVLDLLPAALVVRLSQALFGPGGEEEDCVGQARRALATGVPMDVADDETVSPTALPDLVQAVLDLLLDGERQIWHLANSGPAVTWAGLAARATGAAGKEGSNTRWPPVGWLRARPGVTLPGRRAPRPRQGALVSRRGSLLPDWRAALRRWSGPVPQTDPPGAPPA